MPETHRSSSFTPNHHALAREFVLLDNFYHDAEVSADGHHWVTSAYATDYVETFWPSTYAGGGNKERLDLHDDPVAPTRADYAIRRRGNSDVGRLPNGGGLAALCRPFRHGAAR